MLSRILQTRWFTVAALFLAGFFVVSLMKIEPALVAGRKELNNLDKKIAEIQKSDFELERLGDYLKSNAYLEHQARLKLNYKKPDEQVVYVYQKNDGDVYRPGENKTKVVRQNKLFANLKSWWQYLADK